LRFVALDLARVDGEIEDLHVGDTHHRLLLLDPDLLLLAAAERLRAEIVRLARVAVLEGLQIAAQRVLGRSGLQRDGDATDREREEDDARDPAHGTSVSTGSGRCGRR
jgi:hypothetical protein